VVIPVYFFKLKVRKGESLFLRERLGLKLPSVRNKGDSLWFHAVSVGEILSLQNLLREIKIRHPEWKIYLSTLTNSGMRLAKEKIFFADEIFFIPFDFKIAVKRYFNHLQPKVLILAESEFWPNLLREGRRQARAIILVNGRISPRSFRFYRKFRVLMVKVLRNIDYFSVQTEKDRKALEMIGVSPSLIEVTGNLKSEVKSPQFTDSEIEEMKKNIGLPLDYRVIVAGSTHKGEEEILIEVFSKGKRINPKIALILAPRHPERAKEVERLCTSFPLKTVCRKKVLPSSRWDILILDTLGELSTFYALCDAAFIGGSLIPWGGHNFLEAAFYKKPIFFGRHMENFSSLAEEFIRRGAARMICSREELLEFFLAENDELWREMGERAGEALNNLGGATEKTIEIIENFMLG